MKKLTKVELITLDSLMTRAVQNGQPIPCAYPISNEPAKIHCENLEISEPVLNKYQRQIINPVGESIVVDVYDVLDAFSVNDAAVAHAIKKLLAPGQRGVKTVEQDLKEAVASVNRAIDREQSRFLRR